MKKIRKSNQQPVDGGIILAIIIGVCIFLWTGSLLLSVVTTVGIPLLLAFNKAETKPPAYMNNNSRQSRTRKERAKHKIKVHFTYPTLSPPEEAQQNLSADSKEKLISLLEVDKF